MVNGRSFTGTPTAARRGSRRSKLEIVATIRKFCSELDAGIEEHAEAGYRLDMIFPPDAPREALLSKDGAAVRLVTENRPGGEIPPRVLRVGNWTTGRAGMEYRDLLPDRQDSKVAVSHIRLNNGGPVHDYVHYHKIDFQMIYCLKGRIKVVYEDQGEPFWLEPGDCVVQPPEIRHRVLECTAGSEVVEVSMPAEHETWVEHDMDLPTGNHRPDRQFNGQLFFHRRSLSAPDLRELLSLRGLGPESDASLAACRAVEAARPFNPE